MKRTVGVFPILLLMAGIAAAGYAASVPERAELLVDVDVFDNQTVATSHYDAPFYGPDQIEALFARCRSNGVKKVTWRAMCQIASYPSRLNYNISEVPSIRSNADERRAEGAFAAKVGVAPKAEPALPELKRLPFGGLVQRVENGEESTFILSGAVSSKPLPPVSRVRRLLAWLGWVRPSATGPFLAAVDAASGRVIARSPEWVSEAFQTAEIRFSSTAPFYVGVFSCGHPDLHVFVADALSLKDGAGRERLANGGMEESDGLLEPAGWRLSGAAFVTLNGDFRTLSPELKKSRFPNGDASFKILHRPFTEELFTKSIESGDPLAVAGRAAKKNGIELYVWFDPIDDGRRALPPVQAWSSRFLEEHPQYRAVDREGRTRWGLLCFGYPEVRRYKTAVVKEMLSYEGVTGVALKTHYQHNSIWDGNGHGDYLDYLYNDVALADYEARWGKPENGVYDTYKLRMIYGGYVIEWLRELRPLFEAAGKRLCLFQAPTSLLDASCGGWVLPPERIIEEKLCDGFLIEPRIHGDSVELIRTSERIRSLIGQCRQNGVRVGFDHWLPGAFGKVAPVGRGAALRDQVLALSREPVDFIGIYEEMCLVKPDLWPMLGEASRAIRDAPQRKVPDGAFVPLRARNILSVDKGGSAYSLMTNGTVMAATELIDGDESSNSSVLIETWPAQMELIPQHPVQVNTLVLIGGHLGWKNQCAPEDFVVEGLVSGAWRQLVEVKGAATRNRHDNTLPVMCRFVPVVVEKLRVTVTRSSDSGKRFLVLREIEAYQDECYKRVTE
jgi:hypothetical protein